MRPGLPGAVSGLLFLAGLISAAAQARPTAVSDAFYRRFRLPVVQGTLAYSLSVSERMASNYNGTSGIGSTANFSGAVEFTSASEVHPLSLVETGGYLQSTAGQPSTFFNNLTIFQAYNTRNWHLIGLDAFSYLPDSPATGLSGIAGLGDVGPPAGSTVIPGQGVLSNLATRLTNFSSGTVSRDLTGSTALEGQAGLQIQRFLGSAGSNALESDQDSLSLGLKHRFSARQRGLMRYVYNRFNYLGVDGDFVTQAVHVGLDEQLTRKINFSATAGAQRLSPSRLIGSATEWSPTVDCSIDYLNKKSNFMLGYSRQITAGDGISLGARNDTVHLDASRAFGRSMSISGSAGYGRNQSLASSSTSGVSTGAKVFSAQAERKFGRVVSAFASYTLQQQSSQGTFVALKPFSGTSHIVGFGITYAPASRSTGRQQ